MFFKDKTKAKSAAITIEESAMLKFGQFGKRIQSVTLPRKNPGELKVRSVKLPSAPPNTSASTIAQYLFTIFGA